MRYRPLVVVAAASIVTATAATSLSSSPRSRHVVALVPAVATGQLGDRDQARAEPGASPDGAGEPTGAPALDSHASNVAAMCLPRPVGFGHEHHDCREMRSARLQLGRFVLRATAAASDSEHDGSSRRTEDVALHTGERVVHGLRQWEASVYFEGSSELTMRRHAVAHVDEDRRADLCIETVHEKVDVDGDGWTRPRRTLPLRRRRSLQAYRVDAAEQRLVRAPELDPRCPSRGYRFLVELPLFGSLESRRGLEGDPPPDRSQP